ncbi:MAG: M14 family zinc carboxypeptidase [Pirellulales bacterium]
MAIPSLEADVQPQRESYARFRVSPLDPATLRCEDMERTLLRLADAAGGRLEVEKFAESYQGRPIYLATIGSGPRRILLWSQMHGDEPTHTAVLLDLLSFLTKHRDAPEAKALLAGATLYAIPMLNPDGAAAHIRFNAQHIDVNRDSQRLESPEGRALHRAVETLRPEFGFNLHNQNARTAIGFPPQPAAVSLMAPPLDESFTETPQLRQAKQVAACFARAVQSSAPGMISRYVAEYMPWAFGEWVQSQGVVTVLVEAGGWPGPDPAPLVEVHFDGLLAALVAIADGSFANADPGDHDRLPRDNELKLYDVAIVAGHVLDVDFREPVRADLALNHSHGHRLAMDQRPDAKIVDLGDLGTSTGKLVLSADGMIVLPGRLAFLHDWMPGRPLDGKRLDALLAAGVTTVIGRVDPSRREMLEVLTSPMELPVNWGFVPVDELGPSHSTAQALAEIAAETWRESKRLGLGANRGKIRRDYYADLAFFGKTAKDAASEGAAGAVLRVVVAGETVWSDGMRTGKNAGTFLRCHRESRLC